MAKMTRIGSYFAVVAFLTDIAKLFLSDGDTLERMQSCSTRPLHSHRVQSENPLGAATTVTLV